LAIVPATSRTLRQGVKLVESRRSDFEQNAGMTRRGEGWLTGFIPEKNIFLSGIKRNGVETSGIKRKFLRDGGGKFVDETQRRRDTRAQRKEDS
jgi:hypothetical protein